VLLDKVVAGVNRGMLKIPPIAVIIKIIIIIHIKFILDNQNGPTPDISSLDAALKEELKYGKVLTLRHMLRIMYSIENGV
jgi:hypothetical protein